MNKGQLIDAVAKESGASRAETARVIDGFITVVGKSLKKGDDVALTGFGRFSVVKRGARKGRNLRTGETVRIKASKAAKFTAGGGLKEAVAVSARSRFPTAPAKPATASLKWFGWASGTLYSLADGAAGSRRSHRLRGVGRPSSGRPSRTAL